MLNWQNWSLSIMYYPLNIIYQSYPIKNSVDIAKIDEMQDQKIQKHEKKQKYFDILKAELQKKHQHTFKKIWSSNDDHLLTILKEKTDCWQTISSQIQNTNSRTCRRRYKRLIKFQEKWPIQLDNMIKDLYQNQQIDKWGQIQKLISNRFPQYSDYTSKKLKQRYMYFLQGGIINKQWTIQQDLNLLMLLQQFGRKWRKLTQYFEGRTELQLKNRYKGTLKFIEAKVMTKLRSQVKQL